MTSPPPRPRLRLTEIFGLRPLGLVLGQVWAAVRGGRHAPRSRFGVSSLRILKPWISLPTWLGRRRRDRRVPIYNLVNRVAAPPTAPYSVRVTFARDYRGGRLTYDSHLGTDFALPVGTPIITSAPGVVVRVANDFDRGGLKVCIDHGHGLFTTSSHLARASVTVGTRLRRGEPVGLSGAAGLEFVLLFPWVAPHLHFNSWLNGVPTCPFAAAGETPLWRGGNDPVPHAGPPVDESWQPTPWQAEAVEETIAGCRDPRLRAHMERIQDPTARAAEALLQRNYRSASFTSFPPLYPESFPRRPWLDLPLADGDFDGIYLPG